MTAPGPCCRPRSSPRRRSRGKLFDVRSQAGILVSHKGGQQFVGVYDSFAVRAGDVTSTDQTAREALLRIDTGSTTPFTDGAGRVWAADTGTFTPASAPAEGNRTDAIAGTTDDELYATYRGNTGSVTPRTLTYALPTKAATTVDLRLHFAERAASNAAAGRRLFDIDVEGQTRRTDFDIFRAAGGLNTATVLKINNVVLTGGVLDLALRASVDYPAISAIEVLCQGACPVDTTAPVAPTGVRATGAQTGVTVAWDSAPETDVAGYRVYRSAAAEGPFTELTSTPIDRRTYVDTTAPANLTSYYRVVAVDTSDNASAPSAIVSAVRPVPVQSPVRINTGGPAQTVGGVTWGRLHEPDRLRRSRQRRLSPTARTTPSAGSPRAPTTRSSSPSGPADRPVRASSRSGSVPSGSRCRCRTGPTPCGCTSPS